MTYFIFSRVQPNNFGIRCQYQSGTTILALVVGVATFVALLRMVKYNSGARSVGTSGKIGGTAVNGTCGLHWVVTLLFLHRMLYQN